MNLLAEDVFADPQRRFFLVIDRLDDAWVDDRIRYKLIRALIETVKAFQRVRNIKIIIAVREDLLRKVFDETKDAGFQEEKYASLLLRLRWKKQQLSDLLDLRIDKLVREQYTQKRVKFDEVFKGAVRNDSAVDYVLDRTLLRPRDAISFANYCIELSEGKESVSPSTIQDAERNYSLGRLRSLHDEWAGIYPNLEVYCEILRGRTNHFKIAQIDEGVIVKLMEVQWSDLSPTDPIGLLTNEYLSSSRTLENVVAQILKLLYTVSAIGIKHSTSDRPSWSYLEDRGVAESQFKGEASVYVHPMLWRSLDIIPPSRSDPRKKNNRS